jgi:4-phosphopantoate--beta-alanine ligase
MTQLSPRHPRYRSLRVRARLAEAMLEGVVAPEGLIAQGRAEAFDYFLGERTSPAARAAIHRAAQWVRSAEHPVLSVNGNVAALAAREVAALARAYPRLGIEVNLFHRTDARVRSVARVLRAAGVRRILGIHPDARIPNLPSDRALVDARGIGSADLCIIPLEDGDRAEALRRLGRRVIAIDLNPLSRTARAADLTIVDELTRVLPQLTRELRRRGRVGPPGFLPVDNHRLLEAALTTMGRRLARRVPRARRRRTTRADARPP